MASVSDDQMNLERSQTLDQSVAGKDGENCLTNGSPNHTDDDVLVATLVSDPLEEVAENRRKKKRVISAADLNSNKKARLDTANSTQKGNKRLENKEKDKESDAKEEKDSDGKLEPPPYTKIRTNHYHRKRNNPSFDEIPICDCPKPPLGQMGCLSNCVNRLSHVECTKGMCKCGDDQCANMRFQKRTYPKLKVVPAGGKGFGVLAGENISQGQFVIEYVGEVIPIEDCAERMEKARHFYFLTIDANEGIDATIMGNIARFINHSCDPNCETQKWWVKGETCVGIFAKKDIKKGTELTFDYQFERLGVAKQKCLCGSANCRGYLGAAPTKNEMEEVRYVFSNHQKHVERMLKRIDIYSLDEEIRTFREDPDSIIVKNKIEGGTGPRFLRRNVMKQKQYWLDQFHETLLQVHAERVKTLEQRKEKRRQEVQSSRSYLMGLDIATLMKQGLVVLDEAAPAEPKLRPKRASEAHREEKDEDKMDTSK